MHCKILPEPWTENQIQGLLLACMVDGRLQLVVDIVKWIICWLGVKACDHHSSPVVAVPLAAKNLNQKSGDVFAAAPPSQGCLYQQRSFPGNREVLFIPTKMADIFLTQPKCGKTTACVCFKSALKKHPSLIVFGEINPCWTASSNQSNCV